MSTRAAVIGALVLAASMTASGCAAQPESFTTGVVYCTSPAGGATEDVEVVEFRQGDEVVATASGQVGILYRAEVPADRRTAIFVDGRLVGSAGVDEPDGASPVSSGGYTALLGEGCPDVPES